MKHLLIVCLLSLCFLTGKTQNENKYYETAVYKESIKTVLAYREGFELSEPIMRMDEDIALVFKFDDLADEVKNYSYTVIHCNADWKASSLSQSDYIEVFADNPVDDYAPSFNTTFNYVNYQIVLPNDEIKLKLSGNYVLLVYENTDRSKLILSQRFCIFENGSNIDATVHRATTEAFKGESHEVDFTISHPNLTIKNPEKEVKVVLMQNHRRDNAVTSLKPLYIHDGELIYDYNDKNVFKAGNEFRYFDNRSNKQNGENVRTTEYMRPYYHKTLVTDEIRSNKKYFFYEDMNGKYAVSSQDQQVQDYNTECDYDFVHFTLNMPTPLLGGKIYVFGALSQWQTKKGNEMSYNFDKGCYELTLLLKHGYYNYIYVYIPIGTKTVDDTNIEGSFWATEDNYQVFVYYRAPACRYDRLIGYTQVSSAENSR